MTRQRVIISSTAAYILLLTILSLVRISAPTPDLQVIGFDKLIHFGFYFGLNMLLIATIIAYKKMIKTRQIVVATIAAILYGVSIEFIQERVGRNFDIYDIVANSIGATIAAIIIYFPLTKRLLQRYLL